jgi:hypothetical protein
MMSEYAGFGFVTIARAVKGANWSRTAVADALPTRSPAALARPTRLEIESLRRSAAIPRQNFDI